MKKSEINIDSPDLKLGNIDVNQPDFKTKEEVLKGKIKSIDLSIKNKDNEKNNSLKGPTKIELKGSKNNDIEISKPNIDINKTSLKDKPNTLKTEIITGTIKGKPQEKVNVKEKIPFSNTSGTIVDINKRPKMDNKIDENKKSIKTESITGSIVGTPRQKYLVEYGSTKGYKRPNNFKHNPEIVIEGTISGIKNIPPTLQSIFQGNINENIILNNDSIKNPKFKIKEEEMPNFSFNKDVNSNNDTKLKASKTSNIEKISLNKESENTDKNKYENITGQIGGNENIKYLVEYGSTKGYKRPNIKKGKDFTHKPEFIIEGIIEGKNTIESNKGDENIISSGRNPRVQLKRSARLDFIEYGSTLNYVRPNIKKGIDYYHEPKVKFSKNDDDSLDMDFFRKEKISIDKK